MINWTREILGFVAWALFVHLIAPDFPLVRWLLAVVVGWLAIFLIGTGASISTNVRVAKNEQSQPPN